MSGAMSLRRRFARRLRFAADRVDPHGAPRFTGFSFTFDGPDGIRFRDDRKGCPIAYYGMDDYERAHTEADGYDPRSAEEQLVEMARVWAVPTTPAHPDASVCPNRVDVTPVLPDTGAEYICGCWPVDRTGGVW